MTDIRDMGVSPGSSTTPTWRKRTIHSSGSKRSGDSRAADGPVRWCRHRRQHRSGSAVAGTDGEQSLDLVTALTPAFETLGNHVSTTDSR